MGWYHQDLRKVNVLDVLQGCTESVLHQAGLRHDTHLLEVVAYRRPICEGCPQHEKGWCVLDSNKKFVQHKKTKEWITGCGCKIECKMFLLNAECPALKWKAVR